MEQIVARGGTRQANRAGSKREQIIDAAIKTLIEVGFSRASTRAIAATGGFNQALIHYHFGSLNGLWLAVVDHTSEVRMERYRAAVESASSLEEMVEIAVTIYREDLESGQMTVISELIAGSLSEPELGPGIVERMQPWIAFVEEVIAKLLRGTAFEAMVPTREAASALVAFYMGVNLLTRLEPDRSSVDPLFETARRFAPLISPMLSSAE
ncbi:MAG: TetR/AcrR family transcriptional regulator [Actinobacteria bacterium]|nr:TetR/AcrR family transcriptional regulator [Actinomycetota bacterium]